ncbi:class I SAM-dependent methyltransferase [Nonomuraea recticatena]|uniref:class I SAM-dependent methyltransferase n=1 Tax=Nonomuraea recticatena TaxID=46178 RepID=UPI0036155945
MSVTGPSRALGRVFDRVADAYDAGRPGYPDELFRALSEVSGVPLAGATVVDVGAGTGISSRALRARGARVVAVDPGREMLARLVARARPARTAQPLRKHAREATAWPRSRVTGTPCRSGTAAPTW